MRGHKLRSLLYPTFVWRHRLVGLLQVALEGAVNTKLAASSLARGELPQGDLIPWTIGQQYQVRQLLTGQQTCSRLQRCCASTRGGMPRHSA